MGRGSHVWHPQPAGPGRGHAKGNVDKKAAGTLFAHLADIRRGWLLAPLSLVERRALFMHFALDWDDRRIAAREAVTDRAVRYRVERGVGKLAAHLNGTEYIDSYDELEIAA
ncbi:hypothetical protein [Streptomyces sp. NPDC058247]|uniref:hypothetical protein n=1 Tax=Streptomyces sp. NPDC058247 TaxID=3346401 RepID=UPI0036F113CF